MTTNKAAALAKFLERKLKEPDGLSSIDPAVLELAVKNAKQTVSTSMLIAALSCFDISRKIGVCMYIV